MIWCLYSSIVSLFICKFSSIFLAPGFEYAFPILIQIEIQEIQTNADP
jgi:hypothetical protein